MVPPFPEIPTLLETQEYFLDLVRNPEKSFPEDFFHKGNGLLSALSSRQRLSIYTNDYRFRFIQTLAEHFPNIKRILGNQAFEALVSRYLQAHPSQSHDLGQWGRELPAFFRKDFLLEELPFIADLALAEWVILENFHKPWKEPIKNFLHISPETLSISRFFFQPSLFLLQSRFPLVELLKVKDQKDEEIHIDLERQSETFLAIFQNSMGIVEWESLFDREFKVLEALLDERSLGDVCEEILAEEDAQNLQGWIPKWVEKQWLINIKNIP